MTTPDNAPAHEQLRQRATRRRGKRNRGQLPTESMAAVINRLLLQSVFVTMNGKQKAVPAVEAITLQLLNKGMKGDARARRVLLRYREFANQGVETRLEIRFTGSDYTQALASQIVTQDDE